MKRKTIQCRLLICCICAASVLLVGCQQNQSGQNVSEATSESTSQSSTVAESIEAPANTEISSSASESVMSSGAETAISSASESTTNQETTQTKSITISVLNLSDVNIGMFSVLDPVTGEQLNLDSMEPGSSVSLECNWPSDIQEFHWALYNENGELCIDASTDVSEVNTAIALVLTGEGTIDDVNVVSE